MCRRSGLNYGSDLMLKAQQRTNSIRLSQEGRLPIVSRGKRRPLARLTFPTDLSFRIVQFLRIVHHFT